MAKPGRATQEKRRREQIKREKRVQKLDRRSQRKTDKDTKLGIGEFDIDPDIAGIVPGPQPDQNFDVF
jgi:hypothetical protein